MIDLHSHILPGLDDGARDLEDSLEIARGAVADGITAIAATPHVREDYPTTSDAMEGGVRQLSAALERAGIDLQLLPGGEISLEQLERLCDRRAAPVRARRKSDIPLDRDAVPGLAACAST